ncbi:MAG: non-canonical purine NTP pyrophosphatase [Firmicutes bacterium]|nr:non-canonical purine NTP pyrophosphatase [Bacillota bacterium]
MERQPTTLPENVIVAATKNRHKIREMEAITARFGMQIIARDEAEVPDVEIVEDGKTFEENSRKKAEGIMKLCGRPTIADDSGLEVDCLGGAPGIYSARFAAMPDVELRDGTAAVCSPDKPAPAPSPGVAAGTLLNAVSADGAPDSAEIAPQEAPLADSDDKDNNRKLIRLIRDVPYEERTARFVSAISIAFPEGETITVRGTVEGHVLPEERGEGGFGYDPLFVPEGYDKTFGQLPAELKNRISHRANALKKLEEELRRR